MIRCRHCGHPIRGCRETLWGRGWVHTASNRERCPRVSAWGYVPRTDEGPGNMQRKRGGFLAVPEYEE